MYLTIVGATGGIGRQLVDQALAAGHTVTAAVRDPAKLHRAVPAVPVDLADPDPIALQAAVGEADAVLSALGPRGRHEVGVVGAGTKALVKAMQAEGCQRIVTVSGAGVSTVPTPSRPNPPKREPGAGWFNRYVATPLARRVIGEAMVDVAEMEDVLRTSELNWTAVRPPYLTNGPATGRYRTADERNVRRGFRLSRADAAHFMLTALDHQATVGKAIAVAY